MDVYNISKNNGTFDRFIVEVLKKFLFHDTNFFLAFSFPHR